MTNRFVAGLLAASAAFACSAGGDRGPTTTEADMIAVARLMATFDRIHAEADLEEFVAFIADDAVFMPPDEPAIVGRQAIAEWYGRLYDRVRLDMVHEPLEVDAFGDVIIHRGNARGIMIPRDDGREPIPVDNKYLMVLKKGSDGSLEIWRAAFNAN